MLRRAGATITAIAVTAVVSLASITPSARAQPSPLRFADGAYEGTLVYTGQLGGADVNAFSGATGTFDLAVAGGAVGEGTFQLEGSGGATAPGAVSSLGFVITGTIDGSGERPVMHGASAHVTGVASALGITVPVDFSFGPNEMLPAPMVIESATCTQVVGDFTQDWAAYMAAQGFATSIYGRFVAVRTGAAGQDALTTLAELIANTHEVASAAAAGHVDADRLIQLVEQAEAFSTSLQKNEECKNLDHPGLFNTALTGIIADLLAVALSNADAFDTADLFLLLTIGLRVGAVGEGAIDTVQSNQILTGFENVFAARLDAAIQANDKAEIEHVYVAALSLGWTDLEQKAKGAL